MSNFCLTWTSQYVILNDRYDQYDIYGIETAI